MRWTLYRRFLLALIPTFALFAAAGLALGSHLDTTTRAEDLALRVGNLGGRIAAALDRHDALSNQRLAEDLLGTFGTDAAVLCVELRAAEAGARLAAAYPPGLGCKGMTATAVAGIPVGDTAHMLSIHYSDAEIAATGRRRWITTLGVLVAAFVATLASATIGYRVMVGRRLRALHAALTATPTDGTRREIEPGSRDELGEIVEAFNAMVRRDEARETLMRQDAERLADQSRRDALTGLLNRRYFEQWTAQTGPRHREEPGLLG
jgi:methyl-accepting chemotaxis protein